MFEPKRKWFYEIDWEDRTVLLKGILSIKEEDYGRFTELALGAGMVEALAEEVGDWTFPEEDGPRGVLEWLGFSVHEGEEGVDFIYFEMMAMAGTGTTWAAPSSMPAPPSSGPVPSSCSWRTGTRQRRRTRASGAIRSMARRCASKMVASSSDRPAEGASARVPLPLWRGCVRYV